MKRTVQLYRGLAAGGAGSFCDCVVARRGVVWFGLDSQPLSLRSNTDTITKDLASFLCIAVGCRKSCVEGIRRIHGSNLAIILIAARPGIHWAGG